MPTTDELQSALAAIRADPQLLARYDVTGDGVLDEREWELVQRMVSLELRTAEERQASWSLEVDLPVLHDRFEVIGLLGRGGQACTYLARDQHNDNTHVVIKELAVRVAADWKSIDLFQREAEVLERLTHDRIPRYIDAFHLDDEGSGVRFLLVQDFVDGEDLGHFVDGGGRWSEDEALRRMADVCDVLDYLHHRSPAVIHRDIKPSNLIVGRDGKLYLVDFGAVQMVVPATVGGSTIIGTSGYVPMEQYMGHAEPASDLYALGSTAVHLLSGCHPADLPFRKSRLQIAQHINVDPAFFELLTSMLNPDVDERPASAAQLAGQLREILARRDPRLLQAPGHEDLEVVVHSRSGDPIRATLVPLPPTELVSSPLDEEVDLHALQKRSPLGFGVRVSMNGQDLIVDSPFDGVVIPALLFWGLGFASLLLHPGLGLAHLIVATLFITWALSKRSTLRLGPEIWRMSGNCSWRTLRRHGSSYLSRNEPALEGATQSIVGFTPTDNELLVSLESGDTAVMRFVTPLTKETQEELASALETALWKMRKR